jgi:hypothetical protein
MSTPLRRTVATVIAAGVLTSCSSPQPAPPTDLARDLAGKITVDGIYSHLRKFAEIADANARSRADGTPGYAASVDYVAGLLRDKGFDVQTPEFDHLGTTRPGNQSATISGRSFPVEQASVLTPTPPGGLRAVTLRPPKFAGCQAADYGSVQIKGAIAIVDDTTCSVVQKQDTATSLGAVGLLVISDRGSAGSPPGFFTSGYYRQLTVPVGVVGRDANAALLRTTAPVTLRLESKAEMVTSRNVVAQTKTGDARNVVVAGAHLDSVPSSPGINDNATGVAALLETAAALGGSPKIANAVRFAFWGSEPGLEGSSKYVLGLSKDALDDIALYLQFDALGSTNTGYFTYDGDQTAQPNPAIPVASVPDGSAGIERLLAGYLNLAGARPADLPLTRAADYNAFLTAGVPFGGITAGGAQRMTEVQARLWGGKAGAPFDPNYRGPRDNLDNVDAHALSVMAPAAAFAIGTYAQSITGVNGVPARDQRDRRLP